MAYLYSGILFSHEIEEILPFEMTRMDTECIVLSEMNQTEKDKNCIISFICGI